MIRPAEVIRKEIESTEAEYAALEDELAALECTLGDLKAELALARAGAGDPELWYAEHDQRQLSLPMEVK